MRNRRGIFAFFLCLFAVLLAARLCHLGILWADEDYHQAAAIQILHGKALYRDLWYDKPPLNIAAYLAFAAQGGWVLRLASALFASGVCFLAFHFARRLWTRREGFYAASLTAFFLVFYFPSATLTLEPDTLMLAPHLGAVYLAWRRRPFAAGVVAGFAMLLNVKGVFVLAACALWGFATLPMLVLGFLLPNAVMLGWLSWTGAVAAYWDQVWRWGLLYAGSPAGSPQGVGAGIASALHWSGFHAALLLGAGLCWWKGRSGDARRLAFWALLSFMAAGIGWRFLPRYLDQMLPPLAIASSRGFVLLEMQPRLGRIAMRALVALALLVPALRFGPRYFTLAGNQITGSPTHWTDIAMDQDSRAAAGIIDGLAHPGDSIFIWGYRPNIVVYTRLPVASRFWDSQPLTGVPADRHLSSDLAVDPEGAAMHRVELAQSAPTFIADGLSLYNPRLDIHHYADLADWFAQYCEVGRTATTIVYRRCAGR